MRLRADASAAATEAGLLVRCGDEETVLIVEARDPEDAREELAARGLLGSGTREMDWRGVLGVAPKGKVFFAAGPDEFRRSLSEHGLLGTEEKSGLELFVEAGVDVRARAAFNRAAWDRRRAWLWLQIPSLGEIRWCAFAPGATACAECLETRLLGNRRNADEYRAVLAANGGVLPAAPMPAVTAIAAGLASLECARLLSGGIARSVGRLSSLDLARFTLESERLLPVPGCGVCAC